MYELPCSGCILDGLLRIQLFDVFDSEAEEVRELSGRGEGQRPFLGIRFVFEI